MQSNLKCPICRGPIQQIQKVFASHVVTVEMKQKSQKFEMQKIENAEVNIFEQAYEQKQQPQNDNDDQDAWPEDAKSEDEEEEEEEEEKEDDGLLSIRIAPCDQINDDNVQNIVLEIKNSENKRCPVDICMVLVCCFCSK